MTDDTEKDIPLDAGALDTTHPLIPVNDNCPSCGGNLKISFPTLRIELEATHECGDRHSFVVEYNDAEIVEERSFEGVEVKGVEIKSAEEDADD